MVRGDLGPVRIALFDGDGLVIVVLGPHQVRLLAIVVSTTGIVSRERSAD